MNGTAIDPDVYPTFTPFGRVDALFDDGAGVRLVGPDDAVAAVRRVIAQATGTDGIGLTPENIEPADYHALCQPAGSGILILEPPEVAIGAAVIAMAAEPEDETADDAAGALDAAAGPIMVRILSDGKAIGTLTPAEFTKAAGAPSSMFLPDVIKKWNDWKEKLGEPERAEWFLDKKAAKRGRSARFDGVAEIPGLRAQFGGAAGALAKLTLAKAIAAARRDDEPAGLTKEEQKAVADTIFQQLGGRRFIAMTGAKDFLSLGEASGAPMGGLRFSLPTGFSQIDGKSTGINRVTIRLNASDTYDIEFGGARGKTYTVRKQAEDIYADSLREVFTRYTGLDTSMGTGGPFATKPVSRKEARDAYDELSYAITDLQGHTDMEMARAGSTDRIERAVETARRLEAGWPKDELQPRGLIERAEGLIDRATELRREGGITEISQGDVKSFYFHGNTLTEAQKAAILAKPSRVTRSGQFEVPRFNKAEVERMVAEFEAENAKLAAKPPTVEEARAAGAAAYAAGLKATPALDPAVLPMIARVGSDAGLGRKLLEAWMRGWTEANLAAPLPDGNLQPGGPRFRYALVNRPADFATLPKGLVYDLLPRPAPGAPHHAMARHGIIVTDRELTAAELKSFELAPLVDGDALDQLADRIAESMRENAAAWVQEAADDAQGFRATVLQAVETGSSGISYSVGDPDALVAGVLSRLRAMGTSEPVGAIVAAGGGGAPGAAQGARDADLALLAQIEAGQHPSMLDPSLADLIEAALTRHPDDADVQAAGERAAVAFSNAIVAATG